MIHFTKSRSDVTGHVKVKFYLFADNGSLYEIIFLFINEYKWIILQYLYSVITTIIRNT